MVAVCLWLPFSLGAVERSLTIVAPEKSAAGESLQVVVAAGTSARHGERIGFFQVEAQQPGDAEWVPMIYLDNLGQEYRQEFTLTPVRAGELRVRARVAFRDGLAGDVDQTGAAIRWKDRWAHWREPTARHAVIRIAGAK
ncbi:MAG: hypothetical protein KIT44_05835 [Opitutaceae bacterium]|nr:hypothetical protein [Opitutaceae bacterium]